MNVTALKLELSRPLETIQKYKKLHLTYKKLHLNKLLYNQSKQPNIMRVIRNIANTILPGLGKN